MVFKQRGFGLRKTALFDALNSERSLHQTERHVQEIEKRAATGQLRQFVTFSRRKKKHILHTATRQVRDAKRCLRMVQTRYNKKHRELRPCEQTALPLFTRLTQYLCVCGTCGKKDAQQRSIGDIAIDAMLMRTNEPNCRLSQLEPGLFNSLLCFVVGEDLFAPPKKSDDDDDAKSVDDDTKSVDDDDDDAKSVVEH